MFIKGAALKHNYLLIIFFIPVINQPSSYRILLIIYVHHLNGLIFCEIITIVDSYLDIYR